MVNYFTDCLPSERGAPLLTIGDFCTISGGVTFIFHDGAIGPLINRNLMFQKPMSEVS
jgi:hypothetical protein